MIKFSLKNTVLDGSIQMEKVTRMTRLHTTLNQALRTLLAGRRHWQ